MQNIKFYKYVHWSFLAKSFCTFYPITSVISISDLIPKFWCCSYNLIIGHSTVILCLYFFLQYKKNNTSLMLFHLNPHLCIFVQQRNRNIFTILLNYKEVKIFATSECINMTDYFINCSSWGHLSSVDEQ